MSIKSRNFACILLVAVACILPVMMGTNTAFCAETVKIPNSGAGKYYIDGDAVAVFKLLNATAETVTTASIGEMNQSQLSAIAAEEGFQLVKIYNGLSALSVENAAKAKNAQVNASVANHSDEVLEPGIFALVHSDTLTTEELIARLKARDDVLATGINPIGILTSVEPNEPAFHSTFAELGIPGYGASVEGDEQFMWAIKAVKAPALWDITTGSHDIHVGVIDTGIDYTHPDLKDNFSHQYSKNFASGDSSDYTDDEGHGTSIAGAIAARGNNGIGSVGVLWEASLVSLRWLSGTAHDAINGVAELLHNYPDLNIPAVNMSFHFFLNAEPDKASNASNASWRMFKTIDDTNRTLIVCSAGNDGHDIEKTYPDGPYAGLYIYPSNYKGLNNIIIVGAADINRNMVDEPGWWKSNYSTKLVHIAAPGLNVLSTRCTHVEDDNVAFTLPNDPPNTKLGLIPGTSIASPIVAGAAALLKAACPTATIPDIKTAICDGADENHCKDGTKYGFLDIKAAYDLLVKLCDQRAKERPLVRDGGGVAVPTETIRTSDGRPINRAILPSWTNVMITLAPKWANGSVVIRRNGSSETTDIKVDSDGHFTIPARMVNGDNDEFEVFVKLNEKESDHIGLVYGVGLLEGSISLSPSASVVTETQVTATATWTNKFQVLSADSTNFTTLWTVTAKYASEKYTGTSYKFTPRIEGIYTITATGTLDNGMTKTSKTIETTLQVALPYRSLVQDANGTTIPTESLTTYENHSVQRAMITTKKAVIINLDSKWSKGTVFFRRDGEDRDANISINSNGSFTIPTSKVNGTDDEFEVFVNLNGDISQRVVLVYGKGVLNGSISLDPSTSVSVETQVTATATWINKFQSLSADSANLTTSWTATSGSESDKYTGSSYKFTPKTAGTYTITASGRLNNGLIKTIETTLEVEDNKPNNNGGGGGGGCASGLMGMALFVIAPMLLKRRS